MQRTNYTKMHDRVKSSMINGFSDILKTQSVNTFEGDKQMLHSLRLTGRSCVFANTKLWLQRDAYCEKNKCVISCISENSEDDHPWDRFESF